MALKETTAPEIKESPGIRSLNDALGIFFWILKWVMLATLIAFIFSGVFIVEQDRVGLILRFGKIAGARGKEVLRPGIHFALPYPIHEVVEIEAGKTRSLDIRSFWIDENVSHAIQKEKGEAQSQGELIPGRDGYAITGDANILHFMWTARYKLKDPLQYFLNLAQPTDNYGDDQIGAAALPFVETAVTNAVVRQSSTITIDDFIINEMQKEKQLEFKESVTKEAQAILDAMGTGIELEGLDYQVQVPSAVQASFDMALTAHMQKDQIESAAEGYRNKTIHQAEGEAADIRGKAIAQKHKVISSAKADGDYIESLLKRYPKDTGKLDVYLRQHYLEAINEVLSNADAKYIVDKEGDIWLKIGKDPKTQEPQEGAR